jgi:penicillin-binding protein 1C
MNRGVALLLVAGSVCALTAALWLADARAKMALPSFAEVRAAFRPSDATLLDRHGNALHELRVDHHGRRSAWIPLSDISPALHAAVIASEDQRFYHHSGVDSRAILAAVARRLVGEPLRGASTISMQLVTLLDPQLRHRGRPRSLSQKWRQMRLAWAVERRWAKAEILEAYLNLASYRGELQGIGAAASVLFAKAPHGISEAEAAILAVLLRAPNAAPATVAQRAWALLQRQGWAGGREDASAAVVRALNTPSRSAPKVALAPHVAQRLLRTTDAATPVRSTLDSRLQEVAADVLRQRLMAVREQRVQDGAILAVENATGEVLAYVAGSAALSRARYVDGIQARRQTGSALKPFLYGMALERRILTAASLLEDAPLDVPVLGGLYRPRNYDERFRGLVTLRTALAASLNIPAVRTLELLGAEAFVQQLRRLGFAGAVEAGDYYGPALALGSVDASLWELVNAYRTLANGGVWRPLRLTPGEQDGEASRRIYSEATAFLLSDILADRDGRSLTFGLENPLATRFWSAVKTGTSKEMRDNWCIGYTRHYTVGVWVGNLSGEPMRNVSGVSGAAPIWWEIMGWMQRTTPGLPMMPPAGVLARRIEFPHALEAERTEWFLQGTEPPSPVGRLAESLPHIKRPISGEVIALDPDIPSDHQRMVFETTTASAALRWVLDGHDLGPTASPLLWEPVPGNHTLSLVDQEQRALDTVSFEVRPAVTTVDSPPFPQP